MGLPHNGVHAAGPHRVAAGPRAGEEQQCFEIGSDDVGFGFWGVGGWEELQVEREEGELGF